MAQVIIVDSPQEAGMLAARAIIRATQHKPQLVLGLATGSSPQPVYSEMAAIMEAEGHDLSQLRGFALDEYVGLPPNHPASYRSVLLREVVKPLGLNPNLVATPPNNFSDVPTAGDTYETQILEAGGIDIQLLGLGSNGHIGFNEPGSSLGSLTRVKTLAEQTRIDNSRFFDSLEKVPTHCVTQGIGTILRARRIFLLAFGLGKAEALARAVEGPISSSCPASAIQLHPRVTVLTDNAAASQLAQIDYYRHAWTSKPEWQHL